MRIYFICFFAWMMTAMSYSQEFTIYKTQTTFGHEIVKLRLNDCSDSSTMIMRINGFYEEYHFNSNKHIEYNDDSYYLQTDESLNNGPLTKSRSIFSDGPPFKQINSFAIDYQGIHYIGLQDGRLKYMPYKYKRDSLARTLSTLKPGLQWEALTILHDKLYGITGAVIEQNYFDSTMLYEIPLDKPDSPVYIMSLRFDSANLAGPYNAVRMSLNQYFHSCDSVDLYLTLVYNFSSPKSGVEVYQINLRDKTQKLVCKKSSLNGEYSFTSLAHESEFMSSRCVLALDLDEDGSSGDYTNGNSFYAPCPTDSISLCDDDLYIHSIYPIDSLQLEFYLPPLDGLNENLLCTSSDPNFLIVQSGPQRLSVYNKASASTMDWKALIQSLRYHNLLPVPTEGSRELRIKMYAKGQLVDALVTIDIPRLPEAGSYGEYTVCRSDPPFDLFIAIQAPKNKGGRWLEPLHEVNTGQFTPGIDSQGIYTYVLDRPQCYSDSVRVKITYYPQTPFNLGRDTVLCQSTDFMIDPHTSLYVPTWSDGKKRFSWNVNSPGWYWAEIKDTNWCITRDSIFVDFRSGPVEEQSSVTVCRNKNFVYKNKSYSSGQTIRDTISRNSQCDSIYIIELKEATQVFKTDSISICEGTEIPYRNHWLKPDSIYFFNLPVQLYACDTSLTVITSRKDLLRYNTDFMICPDSILWYKNHSYAPGRTYHLIIPGTGTDCDTIEQLNVISFPKNSLKITGVYSAYLDDQLILQLYADSNKLRQYQIQPLDDQIMELDKNEIHVRVMRSQDYTLDAIDENGCGLSSTFSIQLLEKTAIYVPNVFSPNGDMVNDKWTVFASPGLIIKSCSIFNNQGQRVFFSDSSNPEWDGTFLGQALNPNVFVYIIEYENNKGFMNKLVGDITLVK